MSIEIELKNGRKCIIDLSDYDLVNNYSWYYELNHNNEYAKTIINNKWIKMHRLILNINKNYIVDHINHNGLDNRRCNLRICTNNENSYNRHLNKDSILGYKGVQYVNKKAKLERPYRARIRYNGHVYNIGTYKTIIEAAESYDKKAIEFFGEYAMTNKMLGLL